MGFNKKFFTTGGIVASSPAAAAFDPLQNFETVTYTGNGSTQNITGYIRKGAAFNGSSSKIDLSNLGLGGAATRTISAWINVNSLSGNRTIFQYGNSAANNRFGFAIEATTGKLYVEYYGRDAITSSSQITVGSWFHVVATYNGGAIETATNTQIYVNGSAVSMSTTGTETGVANTTDSNYGIGYRRASSTQYFNGKIDQVRIFDKALSSSEVTTLYGETYASSTKSTTDIFSDGSAVALYELDGDANDTGGVSGKFGSAAIFNGSNSNIQINGLSTFLGSSSSKSWSCWVKTTSTSGGNRAIISDYNTGAGNYNFDCFMTPGNGKVYLVSKAGGTSGNILSSATINDGVWHHICAVQDTTTNTLEFYIDSNSQGTISIGTGTRTSPLFIGTYGAGYYWDGSIDDVRIYSDVLTSTEVGYIYNNTTASIPTDNLEAYYKLDGDATDETTNYDGSESNVTYAYDGTATNVNYLGMAFQPDFVWIKSRDNSSANHYLIDSVRGIGSGGRYKFLSSDLTLAENATTTNHVSAINNNGFIIQGNHIRTNASGDDFVAWNWKAGGAAVSNTDGSITSQVSANTDAGFSIVKYTGNGTSGSTIGHGLSDTPQMMISKRTDSGDNWNVYTEATGNTGILYLNLTDAFTTVSNRFNNTSPTSTVFTVGNSTAINVSGGEYIAYCFHSVSGYQSVGSYTGTNATNSVTTGFEPRFLMVKLTSAIDGQWVMYDNARSATNPRTKKLAANSSVAENDSSLLGGDSSHQVNFTSTGFELLETSGGVNTNKLNETYIYLAIA